VRAVLKVYVRAVLKLYVRPNMRRLCGIIPPPRRHLVRYSGVFGPASNQRAKLRALLPPVESEDAIGSTRGSARLGRLPWAELLRRVFAEDVLSCSCGGRRTVLAIIAAPAIARTVLTALGLPAEPVRFAPARDPTQAELWPVDAA
jgi:hypothetical protein